MKIFVYEHCLNVLEELVAKYMKIRKAKKRWTFNVQRVKKHYCKGVMKLKQIVFYFHEEKKFSMEI